MASAKLIKNLEKKGFELDYPNYTSNNEMIIEILSADEARLKPAITILLQDFDYNSLIKRLTKKQKDELDRIILITKRIYEEKNIESHLPDIIKEYKISIADWQKEYSYFLNIFEESQERTKEKKEEKIDEITKIRTSYSTNEALEKLFKPGKIRVLDKIFNHKPLTETEMMYYYRSIRPTIISIQNPNLQNYLRIIESIKKYKETS